MPYIKLKNPILVREWDFLLQFLFKTNWSYSIPISLISSNWFLGSVPY